MTDRFTKLEKGGGESRYKQLKLPILRYNICVLLEDDERPPTRVEGG